MSRNYGISSNVTGLLAQTGYRGTWATLLRRIDSHPAKQNPRILNAGAGTNTWLEDALSERRVSCRVDRLDVVDAGVAHPLVDQTFLTPLENMLPVRSAMYDFVVATYVLEHVPDLSRAAAEVRRVLKPSGVFVAALPNVLAPEFLVARLTPHSVHTCFQPGATPTHYAYWSLKSLVREFAEAGVGLAESHFAPVVFAYCQRLPRPFHVPAAAYDNAVAHFGLQALMGDALLTFIRREHQCATMPATHL